MNSKYLKPLALKGLIKVGNIYLPGHDEFPSFSRLGCADFIDRVLEDVPESDRDGLALLFTVFNFLPAFFLRGFFNFLEWAGNRDLPAGAIFRQIRMGMRGIVYSLYYSGWKGNGFSGKAPLEILDYQLNVVRD